MARPTKSGLEYFPIDCNFDDKTDLFIMENGAKGLGILVAIWQLIYSNHGYYCEANDDLPLLIRRKVSADINEINVCINSAVGRGLFDKSMFEKHRILTSSGVQKQYIEASKRRNAVQIINKFLIIDVSAHNKVVIVDINGVNVSKNYTKESKVKESKVKNTKTSTSEVETSHTSEEKDSDYKIPDQPKPPKPKPAPKPKPKPKPKSKFTDEHFQMAVWMSNPVKKRFGESQKIDLEQWADAIRKLMEIDKYTAEQIEWIWRCVTTDERQGFNWSTNCRTPMKLRERKDGMAYFEIIKNQFTGGAGNAKNQSSGNSGPAAGGLQDRVAAACRQRLIDKGINPGT